MTKQNGKKAEGESKEVANTLQNKLAEKMMGLFELVVSDRSGVKLRVYGAAKTVVDCFKHRNKIGLDVALEALKDVRAKRKATPEDLWRYAKVCRVANVMRPYLEAVE